MGPEGGSQVGVPGGALSSSSELGLLSLTKGGTCWGATSPYPLPQALSLRGLGDHTPWAPTLAKLFPESTEWVDSTGSRGPMRVWGMQARAVGHVFFLTI